MIGFDPAGKLNLVLIDFSKSSTPATEGKLRTALTGAYGAPVDRMGGGFPGLMWRDAAKGTTIKLWEVSPGPVIEYRAAASPGL